MKTNRYEITVFDSESNSRIIVLMFATCMTHAAVKAKNEIVRKGIAKSENLCIRSIHTH